MQTPAIIASLTVVGSIAYATGSQGVAGKQSSVMPSGSQMHSMQEEMPQTRMQQIPTTISCSGFSQGELWFTTVRDLGGVPYYGCSQISGYIVWGQPLMNYSPTTVDVNGDGSLEYLQSDGNQIMSQGSAWGFDILANEVTRIPGGTSMGWRQHASSNALLDAIRALKPTVQDVYAEFSLRDMDDDGDLDLVVSLRVDGDYWWCWIENTGYEKPAPAVAADLNHDGKVDGADMGLLLYAWGSTQ